MSKLDQEAVQRLMDKNFPHGKLQLEALGEDSCRLRLPIEPRHLRPGGTVSGPTLMAVADAAVYIALIGRNAGHADAVTASFTMHFLRRPEAADVVAECRLLRCGKTQAVGEVALFTAASSVEVARATVSYALPGVVQQA